ncbi:MAG: hypothetical protein JXX14_12195 [Deltaproteobacteria bacterium]|nr:hypothetical protein [Deltaproteobacteria bacterium]
MRPKKQWLLFMACLVQLALLTATTNDALALYRPAGGFAHFRARAYTQFSLGPAITFYAMHRELVDPVPGVDNQKKWWRFLGGARNYDLSMAYVFENGLILGGDLSLLRSQGMSSLQDISIPYAPENPGEVYSVMLSPVVGFYPKPYLGLSLIAQPLIGYSTFAAGSATGGLRVSAGYEWPAGPSGAMGLSLAMEMMFSKTEMDGNRPTIRYDVVHLPVSAMLNICFKGFWDRRAKNQPESAEKKTKAPPK